MEKVLEDEWRKNNTNQTDIDGADRPGRHVSYPWRRICPVSICFVGQCSYV